MTHKLIGTKPYETPDQTIVRCANNLIKAILAAGYSLHSTDGISGCDVKFYSHVSGKIYVQNIMSDWRVSGNSPLKITFCPTKLNNDLTQDDA